MEALYILIGATIILCLLSLWSWLQHHSIGQLLGIFFIYYWTLHGAWFIIADRLGHESSMHYSYLETIIFPIHLDEHYNRTIIWYSVFTITTVLTMILLSRRPQFMALPPSPILLSHRPIFTMAILCGVISMILAIPHIAVARAYGRAVYVEIAELGLARQATLQGGIFGIHQVCLQAAVTFLSLGLAAICSSRDPVFIGCRVTPRVVLTYYVLTATLLGFCLFLGQKGELFVPALIATLFYLRNARRPAYRRILILVGTAIVFFGIINITRSLPPEEVVRMVVALDIEGLIEAIQTVTRSNEAFAAHFSLYGILSWDLSPKFGYSFMSLAASVVPRILWIHRPDPIYGYYAQSLGLAEGYGYTIHHASAWFLNFGNAGIVLGAIVLGAIWASCHNAQPNYPYFHRSLFIIKVIASSSFVSGIPFLIRAGPEGYKGLLIDSFLMPIIILTMATMDRKFKAPPRASPYQLTPIPDTRRSPATPEPPRPR